MGWRRGREVSSLEFFPHTGTGVVMISLNRLQWDIHFNHLEPVRTLRGHEEVEGMPYFREHECQLLRCPCPRGLIGCHSQPFIQIESGAKRGPWLLGVPSVTVASNY